jgi:dTDP-4-dehydrorhamnose 3,5-epimerase
MRVIDTTIPDVKILEPRIFEDERGSFFESFNQRKIEQALGRSVDFVQDNHSLSVKNVLRGLHYQLPQAAQAKLVRVINGMAFDVVVDARKSSSTYGHWLGVELSGENRHQLWVPEGFAHGFIAMSDSVEFLYKATSFYNPEQERCIHWNDSTLNIDWPVDASKVIVSQKDSLGVSFVSSETFD